jgi:hypothetical protein
MHEGIFQIRGLGGSSHSYVLRAIPERDDRLRIGSNFPVLERGLRHIGMKVRDVNLVINSHEHWRPHRRQSIFSGVRDDCSYRLAHPK